MAEQTVVEREYNVPLRKEWLKVPRYKRAKKAVTALRQFLIKHMKTEKVHIGFFANKEIWKHGITNPPHHIKIKTKKIGDGVAVAELMGKPLPDLEKKKEEEKGKMQKALEKFKGKKGLEAAVSEAKKVEPEKKEEPKVEEKKEEVKVEAKPEQEEPKVEEKKEVKEEPAPVKEEPKVEEKKEEVKEEAKSESVKEEVKPEAPKEEKKEAPKPVEVQEQPKEEKKVPEQSAEKKT